MGTNDLHVVVLNKQYVAIIESGMISKPLFITTQYHWEQMNKSYEEQKRELATQVR